MTTTLPGVAGSEEEALLAETFRRYAREELLPNYGRWKHERFPRSKVRELGDLGVLGISIGEEFGGSAGSLRSIGLAAEELSRGDINVSYFVQLATVCARLVAASRDGLADEWLPGIATGERILAFGLTEPGVGSDAANLSTRAHRNGSDWVLNGEKASITFAGQADACVVFARTGGAGAPGISMFLVPLDLDGVARAVYDSAGATLTERGSLFFDDVRLPDAYRLGEEGTGFVKAMQAFDFNRAIIALACVGAALQSLDETIEYTKRRETFGKPLARHQGVSFQVAEHLAQVHAARLVAYQTLDLADQGRPHTTEAAMAKWLGPKSSAEAIHACVILNGFAGWGADLPLSQRMNDVIGLQIGDGTPEIMKAVIAREVMGRQFSSFR